MKAQQEQINLLAVLESYAVERDEMTRQLWRPRVLTSFLRNVPNWLHDNLHPDGPFGDRLPWGNKRRQVTAQRKDGLARAGEAHATDSLTLFNHRRQRLLAAHDAAMAAYHPGLYGGRVTLLRVKTLSLLRAHDAEMGWGKLAANGVAVRMVAGAHYNILEKPNVVHLAAQLRASLEEAQIPDRYS